MISVLIHESQFPRQAQRDLEESLRGRWVNPKLHYLTHRQAQKWLALHRAYSPWGTDPDCAAIYEQSFAGAAARLAGRQVELISLGCGGGQKDVRLLSMLAAKGKRLVYVPCDASLALVLIAHEAAMGALPALRCHPMVCDLATAEDLPRALQWLIGSRQKSGRERLLCFLGMIPNFEPEAILPRLAALAREGDWLLMSANLAPGADYQAGMEKILGGYDNERTKDWLMTFLVDMGVESGDGVLRFGIQNGQAGLKRVVADFSFGRARTVALESGEVEFQAGEMIRLFFSYRYTAERVAPMLEEQGLALAEQWLAPSGEEGVFLFQRRGAIRSWPRKRTR